MFDKKRVRVCKPNLDIIYASARTYRGLVKKLGYKPRNVIIFRGEYGHINEHVKHLFMPITDESNVMIANNDRNLKRMKLV